jgi:hypothetical protein
MKTLLLQTPEYSTYKFESSVAEKTVTFKKSIKQNIEDIAEKEYQDWLKWLGVSE